MIYLVQKYSPNDDSLYPTDLYKRAEIDQLLYFNSGVIFPPFRKVVVSILPTRVLLQIILNKFGQDVLKIRKVYFKFKTT